MQRIALLVAAIALGCAPARAEPLTVRFVTDWRAQAEHGGFYQAQALGLYAAKGLDVRIVMGGPQVNIPQLLAAGAADFGIGSNSFIPLNLAAAGAEVKAVMAVFQKDPQVLIAHPRDDVNAIADMKGKPIMISDATIGAWWPWLRAKYGFSDSQIRKYTFNLAPFLVDPLAIQQGYLSSEPYLIEREGGFKPEVYLLSDAGYPSYATLVLVPQRWIETNPQAVRAFVEATREGWRSYLHGDPAPANALILRDNPEMTPELIAHAIAEMNARGIVESGDAGTLGIGAMTEARWEEFFTTMAAQGLYERTLDWRKAYTLEFLN